MGYYIDTYLASTDTYDYGNSGREYIVVHYTATQASARNNCVYFSGGNRNASAHYFIDDDSIWLSVPEEHTAWHAGNWWMNTHSIGIEVVSDGRDFSEGEIQRLAWLVGELMRRYGIPAERVIRHYDVADIAGWGNTLDPHKRCPAPYVDQGKWNWLHASITDGQEDDMPSAEEIWNYEIDGVRACDRLRGCDIAANGANNKIDDHTAALKVWEYPINGVQARDRLQGIDLAANKAAILDEQYLPAIMGAINKVANANGVDVSKIASQVQAAVKAELERISLDVKVK